MDRNESEDARTSQALRELAARLQALERDGWLRAMAWENKQISSSPDSEEYQEVEALGEAFNTWHGEASRGWSPASYPTPRPLPVFWDEYSGVILAGGPAKNEAIQVVGARSWLANQSGRMPYRLAIAIIWRSRLTPSQTEALTAAARAAGISFDDLL